MPDRELDDAVVALLQSCPAVWQPIDPDALTAVKQDALFHLTAAALVERRFRMRLHMVGQSAVMEATFSASGEYGLGEAFKSMAATFRHEWYEAFVAFRAKSGGDVSPFRCEKVEPEDWRLTRDGRKAIQDLKSGRQRAILDYVLRRGPFAARPPIAGAGQLIEMKKVEPDAGAASVKLTNWAEGAQVFAAVLNGLMPLVGKGAEQPEQPSHTSSNRQKKEKVHSPLRSWTQVDLDDAIRKYKAERAQAYNDLVRAVKEGKRGAQRDARSLFGRNAIARVLGVKAPAMVSKSKVWQAIAEELHLGGNRGPKGTRHTRRPGKAGLDAALDEVSKKNYRAKTPAQLEEEGSRLIEEAERREADAASSSTDDQN